MPSYLTRDYGKLTARALHIAAALALVALLPGLAAPAPVEAAKRVF